MVKSALVNFVAFFSLSATVVVRSIKYEYISSCYYRDYPYQDSYYDFKCAEDNNEKDIISDYLNCDNKLTSPFEYILEVQFTNCKIKQLNRDWFLIFPNLRKFNVSNTELEKLDETNFENAKSLIRFIASNNRLTEIPSRLFATAKALRNVDLSNNRLTEIPSGLFAGEKELRTVDLSNNRITEIPSGLFANAEKLETVDLSHNTITRIDPLAFAITNKVESLKLSFNPLGPLPIGTFAYLTELEYLYLRHVNITTIQLGTFSHQHQLRELDLSENQLKKLDFNVFLPSLHYLTDLHLNQNQLRDLTGFRNDIFPQLKLLDITNNQFNCSYLNDFVNSLDWKVIRLPVNPQLTDVHKAHIRGINCKSEVVGSNDTLQATDRKVLVELLSTIYESIIKLNVSNENIPKINQNSNGNESFLSQFSLILICTIQLIFLAVFLFTKRNKIFKNAYS